MAPTITVSLDELADALANATSIPKIPHNVKYITLNEESICTVDKHGALEILLCTFCGGKLFLDIRLNLNGINRFGTDRMMRSRRGTILMSKDGLMLVPIDCPTHGFLGHRQVYSAPLLSPWRENILAGPYQSLLDARRLEARYSGSPNILLVKVLCPHLQGFVVIVHGENEIPEVPASELQGKFRNAIKINMKCLNLRRSVHFQRVIGSACCHGGFALIDVKIDPGALDTDSVITYVLHND